MFPEPTELLLNGCLIESIWIPRYKSNTLTLRTNLQTYWQREISHAMNGIIFCVCWTSAISVPSTILKRCRKTQEDASEERVKAKSKPMTNLVSRCRVRDPTVFASIASENPRNTKSESQEVPLSSLNVQQTSTGRPVMLASSSNSSEWNIDDKWSSQVRKSGEMSGTSTGRPVSNRLVIDIDMDSDTAAESDFSFKSRSFLNRVNDKLRKMLNRSPEDSMQDIDKRSTIWRMFMSSVFMGKWETISLTICIPSQIQVKISIWDFRNIWTVDIGTIRWDFGVSQISWESSPWRQLSLVNDEGVISVSHAKVYVFSDSVLCLGKMNQNPTSNTVWERHAKVYVFSDSVLCLGKMNQNPTSNTVWERQLGWFKSSSQYRALDTIDGEPMEFKWNISQDPLHLSLSVKSQSSWAKWANQNNSQDE